MLHLVHLKELKTFLWAAFFSLSKNSQKMALTHKHNTTQLSAMCELDSAAVHHKGRAGRDRPSECYPFKISIQGNNFYMCFDYGVVYKRETKIRDRKTGDLKEQDQRQKEFN